MKKSLSYHQRPLQKDPPTRDIPRLKGENGYDYMVRAHRLLSSEHIEIQKRYRWNQESQS